MKLDLKGKWIGKPKDTTKERKAGKHERISKLLTNLEQAGGKLPVQELLTVLSMANRVRG